MLPTASRGVTHEKDSFDSRFATDNNRHPRSRGIVFMVYSKLKEAGAATSVTPKVAYLQLFLAKMSSAPHGLMIAEYLTT